ncbi:cytochrome c3 family protein [Gemmatimonadota bacterium]
MQKKSRHRLALTGLAAAALVLVIFVSMEYTSRSEFCNTCHYMEPFYQAWKTSTHSDVSCVTCHYPPGILSTFEGKVKGMEQLFKYATQSYRRSKPWAEIPDASCLRSGCHDKRLLQGRVKFKEEIIFDHTPHLSGLRRGKQLRCTSCHSQIVQGEHIAVTASTCFLCHFKGKDAEASPSCLKCHEAPVQTAQRQVSYDHRLIVQRKIACLKCHGEMVVGDGAVPLENCMDCHFEQDRLKRYQDTEFIHDKHIAQHKVECQRCHLQIQHKSVSRSASVKPECQTCHPDYHQAQEQLFLGIGGRDVADHPSPMFEGGLNCQACHLFHQQFEGFKPAGQSLVARGKSCEPCHGSGYSELLADWEISTNQRLKTIATAIRRVGRELDPVDTTSAGGQEAAAAFKDAQYNYQLVEYGKSVHNITYADNLLQTAYRRLGEALLAAGSNYQLPAYPWSEQLVPSECANCHQSIEKTTLQSFNMQFNHKQHLINEELNCKTCHSNMRTHGEMVLSREDCLNCHHQPERIAEGTCVPCHDTQRSVYQGTAFGAGMKDLMFEADVLCSDCHIDDSEQLVSPTAEVCVNCHEEGYDDLFSEWQSSTLRIIEEIESLLARLEAGRLGADSRKKVAAARQLTAFFIADRSLGVHNSVLAEEQLSRVLAELKKLLPRS